MKLKPIPTTPELEHGDGFRGEQRIQWAIDIDDPQGQLLAVQCDCGQWWGWTRNIGAAFMLVDHLDANGCGICMG